MPRTGLIAVVLAIASIGAAHAQPASCPQIKTLMGSAHAQVKALQGTQQEATAEDIVYASKTQLAGFADCTLESAKAKNTLIGYFEHHFACDGETQTSEQATQLMEGLWGCLKDGFSERRGLEAWMGGKYRIIGFEGEQLTAGRAAGLVHFGSTNYARIVLDKAHENSKEYDVHIYWYFTE